MQRYAVEVADLYLIMVRYRQLSLSVELSGKLNPDRLGLAVQKIMAAHPILRCRLVETWWSAAWEESTPGIVTVRPWDGNWQTACRWAAEPLEGSLRVIIGQGDCDLLIVKLDHALGDFEALIALAYLLADTVTQLESNPGYALPPAPPGERGFTKYCRRLSRRDRQRIFRSGLNQMAAARQSGKWRLPSHHAPIAPSECTQIYHRCERSIVEQWEAFGHSHRATLFQVLLAAYFLALCEVLPDSDEILPLLVPVSLRRRIPDYQPAVIANQIALEYVRLHRRGDNTLESVLSEVQQHFQSRRAAPVGDGITPLWFETIPFPFGLVRRLIPFAWKLKRLRRNFDHELSTRERGVAMATTIGDLNPRQLQFGSISATHAMGSGHPSLSQRMFQLGISRFDGTLTINLGFGPQAEMEHLLRLLLKAIEPACSID